MRRNSIKIIALIGALSTALPSIALADPLAPGKPAGIHNAQMANKEWLVFGGIGIVALVVVIANVGSGEHDTVANQPITVVAPTTT